MYPWNRSSNSEDYTSFQLLPVYSRLLQVLGMRIVASPFVSTVGEAGYIHLRAQNLVVF
jgi:hypothetical protein